MSDYKLAPHPDAKPTYFDGPTSVAERDAVRPDLAQAKPATPTPDQSYTVWKEDRIDLMAGWTFRPTGSFKVHGERSSADRRGRQQSAKKYIPGYTGFIRGRQHVSGRSFGETTKRVLETDYREIVCGGSIPSDPQHNRKIKQDSPANTFVSNTFAGKVYHIPGYTGYVPGMRHTYARTYGAATSQELAQHAKSHPRPNPQERKGFAFTARPRQFMKIEAEPLPGALRTRDAPDKLVPAHLRHLQFLPA